MKQKFFYILYITLDSLNIMHSLLVEKYFQMAILEEETLLFFLSLRHGQNVRSLGKLVAFSLFSAVGLP